MAPMSSSEGLLWVIADEAPTDTIPPSEHVDEGEDEDVVHYIRLCSRILMRRGLSWILNHS